MAWWMLVRKAPVAPARAPYHFHVKVSNEGRTMRTLDPARSYPRHLRIVLPYRGYSLFSASVRELTCSLS